MTTRRAFLKTVTVAAAAAAPCRLLAAPAPAAAKSPAAIRFGLVTYQWGKDWDLPTLLANCQKAGLLGVELRTTHAHGVEPTLDARARDEVKKRFADSPVTLVGLGSAEDLHHPEPEKLKATTETAKAFIKLSHDVGGSGVKVRPNNLPKNVDPEKTVAQVARVWDELASFAADYGQEVRMEVHGSFAKHELFRQIVGRSKHHNAVVCWNSNQLDLDPPGLEANFKALRPRFGSTAHVRPLDTPKYPWDELLRLFVRTRYAGWLLLEAGNQVPDRVAAMIQQRQLFEKYIAAAG